MSLILSVQEATKAYGPRPLFSGLTLDFHANQRIGLIGPNGAGKSTLLRILAGRDHLDDGTRSLRRGCRLAFLSQDDRFPEGLSIREVILASLADEPIEDHERETAAAIILTKVGFDDHDRPASVLSGGWRKRLALARELAITPDFLLLDEPTNHLDLPGVVWLERFLRDAPFGYAVATHDRAFLRAVAKDIVEIHRAYPDGYFRTPGTYDEFVGKREEFLEGQRSRQASVANVVRRETEWLGRKESAQRSKSASRIADAADRREELADLKSRNSEARGAGIDFVASGRQSKKLMSLVGVTKALGGKPLVTGLDLLLSPGSKVGLLGANGSGKSTLLKLLAGTMPQDAGEIVRADLIQTVLFEQGRAALDTTQSLRKALCAEGDHVMFRGFRTHVVAWGKKFLFKEEQLDMVVGDLSGGEQARVRMAQMMLQPADVLLLDEPTNDLDIPALEVLEESLSGFPGALVIVSHDRELLDRLCTTIVGLDGKGGSAIYGSVTQWLTAYERQTTADAVAARPAAKVKAVAAPKAKKLSYKEQQEFDGMVAVILAAEQAVGDREREVNEASTKGHVALTAACAALEEARQGVEKLYARWEELESKRG